ncbi:MAG: phage portal protein [Piscinibacter sp.]|nr:phage portal protein [Piscinibacter sp.]
MGNVVNTGARGSAILTQWRAQREHQRALGSPSGAWLGAPAGAQQALTAGRTARSLRAYMAASNDRLVGDLVSLMGLVSGNAEVRMSLRAMRIRSRQLANDNEYVKRFLQLLRNNVPGPRGFELQMKIYKTRKVEGLAQLDKDANAEIEEAHAAHSKRGNFTACGKLSRGAFERAAVTCLARDGEVVIEKLVGRQFGRFGLAWRLLDPDLLDETLNVGINGAYPGYGRLDTGHSIRMGVEQNAYGRPVAYWFHNVHPGDDVINVPVVRHRRVPADRIIHRFLAEELRPDTSRGVPWIYAAMRRMAMLGGYEEAALVSARQGASKMGFYKRPADEPKSPGNPNNDGTAVADEEDPEGNLVQEAEPGVFGVLPAGWDFTTYDPAYPNDKMDDFVVSMLRAFCSGVGLNYNGLTGDLRNVSLSAMRHGANGDRDTYEALQQYFRDDVSVPMFEPWLQLSLDLGQIGRLPSEAFERLNKPRFIARPFRSPDPQKDMAARAQAVALGINSRTRICAEDGNDFEEILEELAREEQMAREKKVTLNTAAAAAHKTPAVDDAGKPAKPGAESNDDEGDDEPEEGEDDDGTAAA